MNPKPLTILHITPVGIELDVEAFNTVLDKVGDLPLVIYSISGETRTGKSYLFNYFIRYFEAQKQKQEQKQHNDAVPLDDNWVNFPLTSSFVCRSGKERETMGMNLWSEPYLISTESGTVAVLIMDTQGLFDDKTTARQNAIIFSLAALCSSVLIYNVMRQVNEDLLQQIQYFSGYAHMVQIEFVEPTPTQGLVENTTHLPSFSQVSQNLLLLVRDFEIPGYAHGLHSSKTEPQGSRKNFFRDTFHLTPELTSKEFPQETKIVRQGILQRFNEVSTYLMPDPGKAFIRENSRPDEDFQKELKSFVESLVCSKTLVRKKVYGRFCTGSEFKSFVSRWAALIEKSEETFPDLFTMAENVAYMHYTIAKDTAVAYFAQKMDALCLNLGRKNIFSPQDFEKEYISLREETNGIFQRMNRFESSKFDEDFKKLLEVDINEYLQNSTLVLEMKKAIEAADAEKKKEEKKESKASTSITREGHGQDDRSRKPSPPLYAANYSSKVQSEEMREAARRRYTDTGSTCCQTVWKYIVWLWKILVNVFSYLVSCRCFKRCPRYDPIP